MNNINKKILKIVGILIISGVMIFVNAFLGNPISKTIANKSSNKYIKQNYSRLNLEKEKTFYSFKDGNYHVVVQSKDSIDTNFDIYINSIGKVEGDTYSSINFNTWVRLDKEVGEKISPVFKSQLNYDIENIRVGLSSNTMDESLELDMKLDIYNPPIPYKIDAGFSRRMGQDKLLIKLKEESIIETIIKASIDSNLDKVIIVYRKNEVRNIAGKYNISYILNENANLGQSESIKLGVESIEEKSNFMFIMGDQPLIDAGLINILIKEYKETKKNILIPYYNGHKGTPTIIGYNYKDKLLELKGDKGGRDLVKEYIEDVKQVYLKDEKQGIDIDTLEDLERIRKWI